MSQDKILPIGFVAVALSLSGVAIATAQTGPITDNATSVSEADAHLISGDHCHRSRARGGRDLSMRALIQDVDGDGTVTLEEIDLARAALIAGADANGDGDITLSEYQSIFLELMQDRLVDGFQELDADASGEITGEEVDAALGLMLERMDRNDDGVIDGNDRRGHERT